GVGAERDADVGVVVVGVGAAVQGQCGGRGGEGHSREQQGHGADAGREGAFPTQQNNLLVIIRLLCAARGSFSVASHDTLLWPLSAPIPSRSVIAAIFRAPTAPGPGTRPVHGPHRPALRLRTLGRHTFPAGRRHRPGDGHRGLPDRPALRGRHPAPPAVRRAVPRPGRGPHRLRRPAGLAVAARVAPEHQYLVTALLVAAKNPTVIAFTFLWLVGVARV